MSALVSPRTVIEAFLPFSGSALLGSIYDTANLAGLPDQPVRLAIRRLIAAGEAVQQGRGRAGTLTLTDAGRQRLERDRRSLALARAQDTGEAPWDSRWRLIAVSAPERERWVRDMLRRELHELGAVTISTGLSVSPHDLATELSGEVRPYISTATTDDLNVRGTTDPMAIAELLWPDQPIVAAYSELEAALQRDASQSDRPPAVRLLILAEALEAAMRDDPLIPLDLRAPKWEPSKIRLAFAERWRALSEQLDSPLYPGW